MKLDAILALRPPPGASAADLSDAVSRAVAARATAAHAVTAAGEAKRDVLAADDKTLAKADSDAAQAKLTVDRIEALLPQLRADLAVAIGRETLAELRAEHAVMLTACRRLTAWQTETYPKIAEMIAQGFEAQAEAEAAIEAFKAGVVEAYARQEVREAGPLGVEMPRIEQPIPHQIFPNWKPA